MILRYKFECEFCHRDMEIVWTWLLCAKCQRQYHLAGGSVLDYIVREADKIRFKCKACGSDMNVIRLHLYCLGCKVTRKWFKEAAMEVAIKGFSIGEAL